MRVVLFGASGMVGQGVLRECLLDPNVESVLAVGRGPSGKMDPKLREIVHPDFLNYGALQGEFAGFDVCFFCLGISSAGITEERYRAITYDYTLAAARTLGSPWARMRSLDLVCLGLCPAAARHGDNLN